MTEVGRTVIEGEDEDSGNTFEDVAGFVLKVCERRAVSSDFRELNWFCIFISKFWKRLGSEASEEVLGEVEDINLAALITSRFTRDSRGEKGGDLSEAEGAVGMVVEELVVGEAGAEDAEGRLVNFWYASSFLFDSNSEHLVEKICICSLRSLIVLSFSAILSRQASRSILRDSFANLNGSVARVFFCFDLALGFGRSAVVIVFGMLEDSVVGGRAVGDAVEIDVETVGGVVIDIVHVEREIGAVIGGTEGCN